MECVQYDTVILGAGPAGLSAAYELAKRGRKVLLLEKDPHRPGGLSATLEHRGYFMDIGGQGFSTQERRVENFWREVWPGDFLSCRNSSRVYREGKFLSRPSTFWQTLHKRIIKRQTLYPAFGTGTLWNSCARKAESLGADIRLGSSARHCRRQDGGWRITLSGGEEVRSAHLVSTIPLPHLMDVLPVSETSSIYTRTREFRFRSLLLVALMYRDDDTSFSEGRLYIQDPRFKVAGIQNYKRRSPHMVPDPRRACLGLEYFCGEGDRLWGMENHRLVELAWEELRALELVRTEDRVSDYRVVRISNAYPVCDLDYGERMGEVCGWLERQFPSLYLAGHNDDNQEQATSAALKAADAILARGVSLRSASRKYSEMRS